MSEERPRLVPGRSARAARRRMLIIGAAGLAALAVGGIVTFTGRSLGFDAAPVALPFGVGGAIVLFILNLASYFKSPIEQAEAEAGYTTVGGRANLDLVDPETGEIIERGGDDPSVRSRDRQRFTVKPSSVMIPVGGLAVALALGMAVAWGRLREQEIADPGRPIAIVGWILGLALVALSIVFVAASAWTASRRSHWRTRLPRATVLVSTMTVDAGDALARLGVTDKPRSTMIAAFDDAGLALYRPDDTEPSALITWSRILGFEPDFAEQRINGRSTCLRSIVVLVEHDDVVLRLPIPVNAPWRPGIFGVSSANDTLDELWARRDAIG
jgi:hypothetical protein